MLGKDFKGSYKIKFIDALFDYAGTKATVFTQVKFAIRIEVENITDFKGTLQSGKLAIAWNKKSLGYVTVSKPVTIEPNSKTVVTIPVSIPTLNIINSASDLLQAMTNGKVLIFNITGDLNFAVGTVKVNEQYKLALLKK